MKESIENTVKSIIDTNFDVTDITTVPNIDDIRLTFANKGLRFEATTLYIDMRGSTKILNKHHRTSVAKLHKAYFHIIVKIAKSLGGEVRSFNGDGMLVFFQGTTITSLNNAVKCAMKMRHMLIRNEVVRKRLEKYSSIDFGIGIDDGHILCSKVGLYGSDNRDLVWIGNAVNKSVKIGDNLKSPYNVGISSYVYENLTDETKYYIKKDSLGIKTKVNMWSEQFFTYNEIVEKYYYTNYSWKVS